MANTGEKMQKNAREIETKTEQLLRPTLPSSADAITKREYAQEELYIRNKEKEQREKQQQKSKEDGQKK